MTYKTFNPKQRIIGIRIDRGMEIKVEKYIRKFKIKDISTLVRALIEKLEL